MSRLYYNRKGQQQLNISSLGVIALTLVLAAVILGLGATVLDKIKATQTDSSNTVDNKTLTWAGNNTAISLGQGRISASSGVLYSNNTLVNNPSDANYTLGDSSITITNVTDNGTASFEWVTSNLNLTFTYKFGSAARNTTGFGTTGTNTMAEFIPTIAIIAVAAIVIGIVLVMFGRRRETV